MITADIEKAFDSIEHNFITATLIKLGFGPNFVQWVKTLLYKQESCVMNIGHSTGFFSCTRGSRQGDPLSAFLFILSLEMLFVQVRGNKNIEDLKIFGHEFKLSAFADDTTYFVKHEAAAKELKKLFNDFAKFSSLRINSDKTEVCGIGVKKGDSRALSGFKVVDLTCESILILGCHHSYNKKLATDRNFPTLVDNMQAVLNQWANRGLSLGGKVLVFKTLGISKMQYLAQMTLIPKQYHSKVDRYTGEIPVEERQTKNQAFNFNSRL